MNKNFRFRFILIALLAGMVFFKWKYKSGSLADRLLSTNDTVRNLATAELPKLDTETRNKTFEGVLNTRNVPDARARRYRLYALRKLGGNDDRVMPECINALADPEATVREEASVSLVNYGDHALPMLFQTLKMSAGPIREEIVKVIERSKDRSIPGWNEMLISNDAANCLVAAEELNKLGALKKSATPMLNQFLLKSRDGYVELSARARFAHVLETADPRRRELIDLGFDLKQPNPVIRYRAALFLSEMTPPSVGALGMLTEALQDKDINVAGRAGLAISRLSKADTERLQKIISEQIQRIIPLAKAAGIDGTELLQKANR